MASSMTVEQRQTFIWSSYSAMYTFINRGGKCSYYEADLQLLQTEVHMQVLCYGVHYGWLAILNLGVFISHNSYMISISKSWLLHLVSLE